MPRRLLNGRYQSEELLGSGGMGEVWRGRDLRLDRPVAIKLLTVGDDEQTAAERFDREARTAARLTHPHIVGVYDFGTEDDDSYLVMELVDGPTVSALIAEGPLPVERAVSIALQACEGVAAAHAAGVVHRDVKPGNLIVDPAGTVKICDFGIARLPGGAGRDTLTGPVAKLGTSSYMSPEQALGRPVDPRTDLYGLGCTLYAMLAGRPPFAGDPLTVLHQHVNEPPPPLREHRTDVPAELDALVSELLAKDPADRPDNAAAVRDRLAALLPARPGSGVPGPRGRVTRPGAARRRRGVLLVAPSLACGALLALVGVALLGPEAETPVAGPAVPPAPTTAATSRPPVAATPSAPTRRTVRPASRADRTPASKAPSRTPGPSPAADPIVAMRLSIQRQVTTGQLNPDAATDLHSRVDAIAREIAQGDTDQAEAQVKRLRDKLAELLRGGKLTPDGYRDLRAEVDRIQADLS
ncbi:serine/threonine protein kinase [Micromonospora auratinigra]|uniref:non-specific serine/threonine protein kinase n=1 Tax=Micromonospora auratinigra TaxID=261654 RepID=A0A1A9A0Z7_9ACTN|nr:serine/threonine protein kinase [Micromonospora auratinigra]SBT49819.1 serine/threonine protein kinase [Micromonospora auratinigra]